jgi:hypothetical protein
MLSCSTPVKTYVLDHRFLDNFVLTPGTFIHIIMLLMYIYMDEQATRGRILPSEIRVT